LALHSCFNQALKQKYSVIERPEISDLKFSEKSILKKKSFCKTKKFFGCQFFFSRTPNFFFGRPVWSFFKFEIFHDFLEIYF